MNNSTGGENETSSADKGLKMKIKRTKAISGQKSDGNSSSASTASSKLEVVKGGGSGYSSGSVAAGSSSQENSNSSSTSNNSSLSTGIAPSNKMANHSPFEKLRQAILDQENKSKQAKQKSDSVKDLKGKNSEGNSGSREGGSGFSGVFRGSGNHTDGSSGFHSAKHQKNDPYEFNAKNEDRLGGTGLPSKKLKTEKQEKSEMRDVMTDTSSVSVMTDPDCLGPCEPGTSVVLEGIVWQETENGLLVVNVTWRGKTYVGTLLDATKHEWAPPSFRSDSPQDPDARTPRGGRGKRGRTTMNSMGARGTRNTRNSSSTSQSCNPPPSPAKTNSSALPVIGEKRKPEGTSAADVASPAKKQKFEIGETVLRPNVLQETWFVCSHPDCSKRYRQMNALKYHQNNAHKDLLLQQEQSSEHNKTHVRFAGMQQNTAAQTDEKPNKEKRNKKKKNKKNKSEQQQENQQQMEVDQVNNENVNVVNNVVPTVKCEPCDTPQQSNQTAALNNKNSPDSSTLKQPRIQLSQVGVPNTNNSSPTAGSGQRTVTAPIVAVPVGGGQSSPTGNNGSSVVKTENSVNSTGLSKEEKKKEKKKKKKEKKEKKLLEQQQQQQQQKDGSGNISQQQGHMDNSLNNKSPNRPITNSSTPVTVPAHSTHAMSTGPPGSRQINDKQTPVKDNVNNMSESVHSPAYSDISDEGNDNVPVLENEVELAKKQQSQQQTIQPKESEVVPKGLQQEPPNLTPVITHTGHSKNVPSGSVQSQVFPNKDIGRPSNLALRNAGPQQANSTELNRQKEGFSNNIRDSKPPQTSEMHQARPNMAPQQQKPNVYGSYPQGYNYNQSPSGNTKPSQMTPNQDKLTTLKPLEDKSRNSSSNRIDSINQGHSPNGPSKVLPNAGIQGDLPRRSVDSNMNMPPKMLVSPQNSQQMGPTSNINMPPNTAELSKQVSHLNKSEAPKSNNVEQHYKQSPGGMSISERQSENEKILKENIDIKRQMNEKDKQAESSIMQKEMIRRQQMFMMQQQQHMMDFQHQKYIAEQRGKTSGGPPPQGGEPRESPKPSHHLHSSHPSAANPGLSRKENSPLQSPKTKAELKQGTEPQGPHQPVQRQDHRPDMPREHRRDMPRELRPDIPREHRSDLPREHRPDIPRDHRSDMPRDHRPDMPREHRQDIPRDHRPDMLREHRPDMPRDHRPDMPRDHRPDMSRDHRPDMPRDHRPDMHREHRPDMPRDHHRMDISRDHRMDPSREHRIDLSRESRPEHRQEPPRDHRLDTSREHRPEQIRDHRSLERHTSDRHLDSRSNEAIKRPPSNHPDKPDRKDPPKSPAPAPSLSSPSMSSPVPPPASIPHNYPYGYPGYPPMYPGMHPFMAAYPGHHFMSYGGVPPQDGKALEMLQQHASQYYNRDQMKAQDLRKIPDRKSPNPDGPGGERPNSRNQHADHKRGESPGLSRASHIPGHHPNPWFNMHNGGPVPMMQPSPQSSSAKH